MIISSSRMRAALLLLATTVCKARAQDSLGVALVEWLESKGGFFHPKLEIRRRDPLDDNSKYGIFAKDAIDDKEKLIVIPRSCLIEEKDECETTRRLIHEMKLGDDSDYAPYVQYLAQQKPGQLPSAWSKDAKALLKLITNEELPPVGIFYSWKRNCDGNRKDAFEVNAYHLVVQRGWDNVLVPIYDMTSHRNGPWLNTVSNSVHKKKKPVTVKASRDIDAGEEIYMSYNFCKDCGARKYYYGTPEILRDYGFVEEYPQRWVFTEHEVAFDLDESEDSDKLKVTWLSEEPTNEGMRYLEGNLQRLNQLAETTFASNDDDVPEYEWQVITQYLEALRTAIARAMEDTVEFVDTEICDDDAQTCAVLQDDKLDSRYDELKAEQDKLDYAFYTCDFGRNMEFYGYENLDVEQSTYQNIHFYQDPKTMDTCFELDKIVQICSCYRPHYHEMMVHYTARFLDSVKRTLFVGGGDSMLLHEFLKYPSLELVVGLELDQKVTRLSFKNFGTQPHWDNEKVQWWFGDAAKSLLMLPKDYFGSFDMVLVDLSETVMSMSVTDRLDILGALALLLKPEGILVKNELYLEKASEVFDYVFQAHFYDVPVICSQTLVFGSNTLDFLTHPLKDHGIEDNLYLKRLEDIKDRYDIWHDYRKGDYRTQKHCKEREEPDEEPVKQVKSPGILMIVEAEDATAKLEPSKKVKGTIVKALKKQGLHVVSTIEQNDIGAVVVVILREGYVIARTWPQHKYCAFDIHLWSSFDAHDGVRKALVEAVGSNTGKSSSSFRIAAGGMFGVSTWKEDEKKRGPRVTQLCDRSAGIVRDTPMDESVTDVVLEQSMSLIQDNNVVAAVICGQKTEPCKSLGVLYKNDNFREVIPLWTCPSVEDDMEHTTDDLESMLACEQEVMNTLKKSLPEEKRLHAVIVDSSAPFGMAQIVHSIFKSKRNRLRFLARDITVMAPMLNETETWRRNFLERFRRDVITFEPVFRGEVIFNNSDSSIEMGVTTSGDPVFFQHLLGVTANIEKQTGLVSDLRNVQGGLFNNMPDFVPSQFFAPKDYDHSAALEQWRSQQPLGYQAIFQLEMLPPFEPLAFGDRVKGHFDRSGQWYAATVVSVNSDNTFDLHYDDGDAEASVDRSEIRKLQGWSANVEVGDTIEFNGDDDWVDATVVSINSDNTFEIEYDDGESEKVVARHQFRKRETKAEKETSKEQADDNKSSLSTTQVNDALKYTLSLTHADNMTNAELHEFTNVGDGCVLVALWSGGSAIVLWDGRKHVDINLFTYDESKEVAEEFATKFQSKIPRMELVLRDEQPRGFGRVVNFLEDIEPRADPHWA